MYFLITRPDYEITVFYLSKWSKELIDLAELKAINVLDCFQKKANRKTIEEMIKKQSPSIIMFNGHGSPTKIFGHNAETLIEEGKNDYLLNNTIVYAVSCSTAALLGKSCVEKGTKAYIGYQDEFCFWIDNTSSATPLNDKLAAPCLLPSNQVMKSLLKGKTAKDAIESSQRVFNEQIEALQKSDAPLEAEYILPLLIWDKENQVLHGKEDAQL